MAAILVEAVCIHPVRCHAICYLRVVQMVNPFNCLKFVNFILPLFIEVEKHLNPFLH